MKKSLYLLFVLLTLAATLLTGCGTTEEVLPTEAASAEEAPAEDAVVEEAPVAGARLR